MADSKISLMTESGALTGAELVEIVQDAGTFRTTTQAIADLGGGGGATIYGADATIADPIRTVTLPANGTLDIALDANNYFRIIDDGGFGVQLVAGGDILLNAFGVNGYVQMLYPLLSRKVVTEYTATGSVTQTGVATNVGAAGDIILTLDIADTGSQVEVSVVDAFGIFVTPVTGTTILFWDGVTTQTISDTPLSYLYLASQGMTAQFTKTGATTWVVTQNNGGIFQLD